MSAGNSEVGDCTTSQVVRFRFSKLGKVRWTSHRDVARMWERALRRAGIGVEYTRGFSPRPRLAFGLALPTGCESVAEYVDVPLRVGDGGERLDEQALCTLGAACSYNLPDGVEVLVAASVEAGWPSLQSDVVSCCWEIEVPGVSPERLAASVNQALLADTLPIRRERKGRQQVDDLRPALIALEVKDEPTTVLVAEMATNPRGVRPGELGTVLGLELGRTRRTKQMIERDGWREELLELRNGARPAAGDGRLTRTPSA